MATTRRPGHLAASTSPCAVSGPRAPRLSVAATPNAPRLRMRRATIAPPLPPARPLDRPYTRLRSGRNLIRRRLKFPAQEYPGRMALDPKKWTLKTQEAMAAAIDQAKANSNPELTPDHLLAALTRQDDTVVPAVLAKLGQAPLMVRNKADEAVARLPKAYGGDEPRLGRELTTVFDAAQRFQSDLRDDFLSVEHLLLAMSDRLGVGTEELLQVLQEVRGAAPRHVAEPGGPVPGARALRPGPHGARPRGQDRSGHRARRRDPPGDPGAVAPHEEQPGPDRRARRRQDRHRRGSGPAHRRRRRPRGSEEQAASSCSTSRRCSPAPSTAASSRSG